MTCPLYDDDTVSQEDLMNNGNEYPRASLCIDIKMPDTDLIAHVQVDRMPVQNNYQWASQKAACTDR